MLILLRLISLRWFHLGFVWLRPDSFRPGSSTTQSHPSRAIPSGPSPVQSANGVSRKDYRHPAAGIAATPAPPTYSMSLVFLLTFL